MIGGELSSWRTLEKAKKWLHGVVCPNFGNCESIFAIARRIWRLMTAISKSDTAKQAEISKISYRAAVGTGPAKLGVTLYPNPGRGHFPSAKRREEAEAPKPRPFAFRRKKCEQVNHQSREIERGRPFHYLAGTAKMVSRSTALMRGASDITSKRSMVCFSSRTLPGQGCSPNTRRAAGVNCGAGRPS